MTDDTRALLIHALHAQDADRPRSQQVMIGPSGLGSCKRQTVYKIMQKPPINETSKIAAVMGTAIHDAIEKALRRLGHEHVELTVEGIADLIASAHIDFYQPDRFTVTDWKTTKKNNLRSFPYLSQRWQVQTYGYLARRAGYRVDTVELVAICRDGTEEDIVIHSEPYDEAVALEALAWLQERYNEEAAGYLPEPEKFASFCRLYCPYYGDAEGYCMSKSAARKLVSEESDGAV